MYNPDPAILAKMPQHRAISVPDLGALLPESESLWNLTKKIQGRGIMRNQFTILHDKLQDHCPRDMYLWGIENRLDVGVMWYLIKTCENIQDVRNWASGQGCSRDASEISNKVRYEFR